MTLLTSEQAKCPCAHVRIFHLFLPQNLHKKLEEESTAIKYTVYWFFQRFILLGRYYSDSNGRYNEIFIKQKSTMSYQRSWSLKSSRNSSWKRTLICDENPDCLKNKLFPWLLLPMSTLELNRKQKKSVLCSHQSKIQLHFFRLTILIDSATVFEYGRKTLWRTSYLLHWNKVRSGVRKKIEEWRQNHPLIHSIKVRSKYPKNAFHRSACS